MYNPQEDLKQLMEKTSDTYIERNEIGGDTPPKRTVEDVDIPDDELKEVVLSDLKNDMSDRDDFGWTLKREYDMRAYHGIKDEFLMNFPYPNASAYPVPITWVQVETAKSLINDLIWRNPNKVVVVSPVDDNSDGKKAKNVESLLNWQALNDITDIQMQDFASTHEALLHGTAVEKILRTGIENYKLKVFKVPIQYFYMPIDSQSAEIKDSDHTIQIIGWNDNDVRNRIAQGVYRNLDKIGKGFIPGVMTAEMFDRMQKEISGLDTTQKATRDTWFIGEYYKTYYPKGSLRAVELIVHFSPTTGAILRKIRNKENMRPYVQKYYYPNYDKAYHYSMPEILRNVQEKATYRDKQKTDASDKAISPAGFYDGTEKFSPRINIRAPTSMYPMKNISSVVFEPVNLAPIIHAGNDIKELWIEAGNITGFTDVQQGTYNPRGTKTLGQDIMRNQKSELRLQQVVKMVNYHWKNKMTKIYQYDDIYMPRKTKVKVLGVSRYETIEKLFPREKAEGEIQSDHGIGLTGKFDYAIANKSVDQQMRENQTRSTFFGSILADSIFGVDIGNHYRVLEEQAKANGIFDLDIIVKRPKEANQFTPDEVIAKLMDGDEVIPDPFVNFSDYITAMEYFMRTGNFKDADPQIQKRFVLFLTITQKMQQAARLAFQDFQMTEGIKDGLAMAMNRQDDHPTAPSNGNGKQPTMSSAPPQV